MTSPFQDAVFLGGEGDAWHRRNAAALADRTTDAMLNVISKIDRINEVRSVCDLGCANGWRLNRLKPIVWLGARLAGADPSEAAIADGLALWPDLELRHGTLKDNDIDGRFDLVVINAVFCWVDRDSLAASIARVDELVASNGILAVADFDPGANQKVPYHHRTDVELFTYKQNYAACFTSLGYQETFRCVIAHDNRDETFAIPTRPIPANERYSVTLMVKCW